MKRSPGIWPKRAGPTSRERWPALLGGRIRICCSGGAALPDHVAEFFARCGVPLVQGYGLTETSPVISTCTLRAAAAGNRRPADSRRRSRDCRRWRNPDARAARHARLLESARGHGRGPARRLVSHRRLGPAGRWLSADHRSQERIIVTAGGKNIAPARLEALLIADPLGGAGDGHRRRQKLSGRADRSRPRSACGPKSSPRRFPSLRPAEAVAIRACGRCTRR